MAKLKFDKQKSLEEGDVVLVQESVKSTEREQTKEVSNVEAKVQPVQLTSAEYNLAKLLQGQPNTFDSVSAEFMESLVSKGVAADFGDAGYARGYKFHEFFR